LQELPTFPEKITLIFSIQPLVSPATPPFAEHQLKKFLLTLEEVLKWSRLLAKTQIQKSSNNCFFPNLLMFVEGNSARKIERS